LRRLAVRMTESLLLFEEPILERVFLYSWKGKSYYMTPMWPMTPKEIRRAELHLKELEDASPR
jgi:hypothetical protein